MSIFEDVANNQLSPEEFEAEVWEAQRLLPGDLVRALQRQKPEPAQGNFLYLAERLIELGFYPSVAVAAVSDVARRAGHNWPLEVD